MAQTRSIPWLAYQSIAQLAHESWFSGDASEATTKFKKAVEGGILKVMSKMGISTLESYKGAQVFPGGRAKLRICQEYFSGTSSYLKGIGLEQIETRGDGAT